MLSERDEGEVEDFEGGTGKNSLEHHHHAHNGDCNKNHRRSEVAKALSVWGREGKI